MGRDDPPDRREEELLSIVPRERAPPYKVRRILEAVFDRGSVFEIGAQYGRPLVTALARLGGRPVGVLASDPTHYGGGLNADASEKLTRFADLCDQFHLPVVNFVDQPGFVIGTEAERRGTIRRGTRALVAVYQATVPWVSVLVRKVYGVAGAGARQRAGPEPPLRVAVGRLGLAADRGRPRGRLPARARGGRGPGRAARRDRGAAERRALAVPDRRALRRRGDHRPARHAADPVRLGRARARAGRCRSLRAGRSAAGCARSSLRRIPMQRSANGPRRGRVQAGPAQDLVHPATTRRSPDALESAAEELVDACDIGPGQDVLDVATGSGNVAIVAAQAGARVIGLDLTPELFEAARRRLAEAALEVELIEGDAEDLPFPDDSFDRVLSAFGVMFAPRHEQAAAELVRVCPAGGIIGIAAWTAEGATGQMFKVRRPPHAASPARVAAAHDVGRRASMCATSSPRVVRRSSSTAGWSSTSAIPARNGWSTASACSARRCWRRTRSSHRASGQRFTTSCAALRKPERRHRMAPCGSRPSILITVARLPG